MTNRQKLTENVPHHMQQQKDGYIYLNTKRDIERCGQIWTPENHQIARTDRQSTIYGDER